MQWQRQLSGSMLCVLLRVLHPQGLSFLLCSARTGWRLRSTPGWGSGWCMMAPSHSDMSPVVIAVLVAAMAGAVSHALCVTTSTQQVA